MVGFLNSGPATWWLLRIGTTLPGRPVNYWPVKQALFPCVLLALPAGRPVERLHANPAKRCDMYMQKVAFFKKYWNVVCCSYWNSENTSSTHQCCTQKNTAVDRTAALYHMISVSLCFPGVYLRPWAGSFEVISYRVAMTL